MRRNNRQRRGKIPASFLRMAERLQWSMPTILLKIQQRYHLRMSHRTVLCRMGELGMKRGMASKQFQAERSQDRLVQGDLSLNQAMADARFGTREQQIFAVRHLRPMHVRLPLIEILLASLSIDLWPDQYRRPRPK